jgi:type II secretion system protein N
MKDKKTPDNILNEEIYQNSKSFWPKLFVGALVLLILGFFLNFPVKNTIQSMLVKGLNNIPGCQISFNNVELSMFLPKIIIKNVELGSNCFGRSGDNVKLSDVNISLRGPSFYPPGVKLHVNIEKGKTKINIYPSISIFKHMIKIDETFIDSPLVKEILGEEWFQGGLSVEAMITLRKMEILEAKFKIKSDNFRFLPREVSGFTTPDLKIGMIAIRASMLKEHMTLDSVAFGSDSSPIKANMDGDIQFNFDDITQSGLNLKGDVKFSPELISSLPIINLLIGGKNSKNGFYSFNIGGTMGLPMPRFQ